VGSPIVGSPADHSLEALPILPTSWGWDTALGRVWEGNWLKEGGGRGGGRGLLQSQEEKTRRHM
jgi:hypothetical protein